MMDLDSLKVPLLKSQLLARGLEAKGSKSALVARLKDALNQEGVDIQQFVEGLMGKATTGSEPSAAGGVSEMSAGQHGDPGAVSRGLEMPADKPCNPVDDVGESASQVSRHLRLLLFVFVEGSGSGKAGSSEGEA